MEYMVDDIKIILFWIITIGLIGFFVSDLSIKDAIKYFHSIFFPTNKIKYERMVKTIEKKKRDELNRIRKQKEQELYLEKILELKGQDKKSKEFKDVFNDLKVIRKYYKEINLIRKKY